MPASHGFKASRKKAATGCGCSAGVSFLYLAQEPLRRRKRPGAFAESNSLGREYGAAMADRGVPLVDTLEAFVFFRSMVLESADSQHWGRILELADRVLVGVAESYENRSANQGENRSENRNEFQSA